MRATVMYGAGDVRIETVPDAGLIESTDALVRVTRACVCGSDLWPYNQMEHSETGRRMGHEFIGVVEAAGADVRTVKAGDVVVAPFEAAVGLCGVIAAKRLGAEQIIILGRHSDRIALAKEFGATDVVSERGDEAIERVRVFDRVTSLDGVPDGYRAMNGREAIKVMVEF